jgi:ribonuclease HI
MTDAAGSGGLGGIVLYKDSDKHRVTSCFSRFTVSSLEHRGNQNSTVLELLAVMEAVRELRFVILNTQPFSFGQAVAFSFRLFSDNQALQQIWRKGYSTQNEEINTFLREIASLSLNPNIILSIEWISRTQNQLADHLSHPDSSDPTSFQSYYHELWNDPSDVLRLAADFASHHHTP